MVNHYRITDQDRCGQILANAIPTLEQAERLLELLKKDHPELDLTIESYTAKPK